MWQSFIDVMTGSGNGLVLSNMKPLPQPMFNNFYDVSPATSELTHRGLVTLYGNIELGQHWLM